MKVLLVAENIYEESGGPTKVACELAETLAREKTQVVLFAATDGGGRRVARPKGVEVRLFPQDPTARWWPGYSSGLAGALEKEAGNFDLIHAHEIWHYPHYAAYRAAKKAGKPYVLTVHGSLDPWCLEQGALKKKAFSFLLERRIFRGAAAVQALTEKEAEDIRIFEPASRVVTIPNGVNPEDFRDLPPREKIEQKHNALKGKQVILFLGRIHPKKGLDILALAFADIARRRNDVCLLVGGPDNNYRRQLEKMFGGLGVADRVVFAGMLAGSEKLEALSRADIFTLPSYSEGFSMAILEAMACGLPVVITNRCNFPEVAAAKAGKIIEPDAGRLAREMESFLNDSALRGKTGENARKLIKEKFTLEKITGQMIEMYRRAVNN